MRMMWLRVTGVVIGFLLGLPLEASAAPPVCHDTRTCATACGSGNEDACKRFARYFDQAYEAEEADGWELNGYPRSIVMSADVTTLHDKLPAICKKSVTAESCVLLGRLDAFASVKPSPSGGERLAKACDAGHGGACRWLARLQQGQKQPYAAVEKLLAKACRAGSLDACADVPGEASRACAAGSQRACWKEAGLAPASPARAAKREAVCTAGYPRACTELARETPAKKDIYLDKPCFAGNLTWCAMRRAQAFRDKRPTVTLNAGACNAGDALGCVSAATAYATGDGVPRDDAKRRALLDRGCALGEERACVDRILADVPDTKVIPDAAQQATILRAYTQLDTNCRGGSYLACVAIIDAVLYGKNFLARDPARAIDLIAIGCKTVATDACDYFTRVAADLKVCTGKDLAACEQLGVKRLGGKDPMLSETLFQLACDKGRTSSCEGVIYALAAQGDAPAARQVGDSCVQYGTTPCEVLQFEGLKRGLGIDRWREVAATSCDKHKRPDGCLILVDDYFNSKTPDYAKAMQWAERGCRLAPAPLADSMCAARAKIKAKQTAKPTK